MEIIEVMKFNLNEFNSMLSSNTIIYPKNFLPFIDVDRFKYYALEKEHHKNELSLYNVFKGLNERVGEEYFKKVYKSQCSALNFSETSFPLYRFLMPDILTDDWLAIVDIHKKHCRDHALHQPLTSYVVYKILGGGNSDQSFKIGHTNLLDICVLNIFDLLNNDSTYDYFYEYIKNIKIDSNLLNKENQLSQMVWKSLFFEAAMTAAIFHDIGYPWQYINRLNRSLDQSDFNPDSQPINTKNVIDNYSHRLLMSPFNGYKKVKNDMPCDWNKNLSQLITKALTSTHGFPGAIGYLYLNDKIRKYPTITNNLPLNQLCIEWAALGIMMHDMAGVYWGNTKNNKPAFEQLQLSLTKDPLSCIIALADVIEDFERPYVTFNKCKENSCFHYHSPCNEAEIVLLGNKLEIRYFFEDQKEAIKNQFIKERGDQRAYFHSGYGYLDFSSIGVNNIEIVCQKKHN